MIALVDIEIQVVNFKKQQKVHEEVMKSMGPSDPTVIVTSVDGTGSDGVDVSELLEKLEPCGLVVLVRIVDDDILITFQDGRSALKALDLDGTMVRFWS